MIDGVIRYFHNIYEIDVIDCTGGEILGTIKLCSDYRCLGDKYFENTMYRYSINDGHSLKYNYCININSNEYILDHDFSDVLFMSAIYKAEEMVKYYSKYILVLFRNNYNVRI